MIDTIIVSGGNIHSDFALDFLEKQIKENEKICLIAADRGLEFFLEHQLLPDVAIGDFDSLSAEGTLYLQGLRETEIMRLKPEKDDSDTQSAVNFAIDRGAERLRSWVRPETGSITLWLISDCWYMEGTEVRISYWSISGII